MAQRQLLCSRTLECCRWHLLSSCASPPTVCSSWASFVREFSSNFRLSLESCSRAGRHWSDLRAAVTSERRPMSSSACRLERWREQMLELYCLRMRENTVINFNGKTSTLARSEQTHHLRVFVQFSSCSADPRRSGRMVKWRTHISRTCSVSPHRASRCRASWRWCCWILACHCSSLDSECRGPAREQIEKLCVWRDLEKWENYEIN